MVSIQKLNPIGYETKTEKGNTYKKLNIGTTAMLATMTAVNTVPRIFKNNNTLQTIKAFTSCENMLIDFAGMLNMKVSPKLTPALKAIGIAADLYFGYVAGRWIDRHINKKAAVKADKMLQSVDNK